MAKFYTDGSENMILYTITDKDGVKIYSKDEKILEKTLIDWMKENRDESESVSPSVLAIRNYDFVWYENKDNTTLCIYYKPNAEITDATLVDTFKLEKLTIPNSMFDPMPSTTALNWGNTIPVPCTDGTVGDSLRGTTGEPVMNPVSVQSETNSVDMTTVRNAYGDNVGIIKTVGVEEKTIDPSVAAVDVPTILGATSKVSESDLKIYQSRLNEAKAMYGTKIEDFIVANSNFLKPNDIEKIRSTYFNGADSMEPAYVFSLHDFSVHAINANGSHVTLL